MKPLTEYNNQWRIIHKIYNNNNGTFDWDDMKSAIKALMKMKLKIDTHVPLLNIHPKIEE